MPSNWSDDSNGPGSPSMLDEPRTNGHERYRKRKRDTEREEGRRSHTEGHRRVRVKTEPGLQDYDDPPTPPVPGASDQAEERAQESGSLPPRVNVKTERVEEESRPESPMPNIAFADVFDHGATSDDNNDPQPGPSSGVRVKSEPPERRMEPEEEQREAPQMSANDEWNENERNATHPNPNHLTGFYEFTRAPPPRPNLPNAMKAEIKHKPVAVPQQAHYHTYAPEDELKYGDLSEKSKRIPVFDKVGEDSEASGSDEEGPNLNPSKLKDGERVGRYYRSTTVYAKYDFKSRKVDSSRLAVYDKKTQILNSLDKARVVIIEGFTGCGKTTQVPQFILDKRWEEQKVCNIVVTQPRKIAAMSVANRVCYERNWSMGSVVGYQVGMDAKTDRKNTVLTFMTTGVLLQKLISMKSMKDFTHIIIDEVHERDLESDFLLLVIKKIMASDFEGKEKHVKLILMSATIDTKKFEDYFVFEKNGEEIRPHVVKIPFVARHRVEELYLDDLLSTQMDQLNVIESNLDIEKATIQDEIFDVCVSCIITMDELEREKAQRELDKDPDPRVRRSQPSKIKRGAVLVFLPGMEEIKRLQRALEKAKHEKMEDPDNPKKDPNYYRWVVLPLHSSVTAEDQQKVFEDHGEKWRKIILSTNIAESSVTVPDIGYVIDFCLTKSLSIDSATNFTTLRMDWAAKSQCIQRKGRTGRVADGKVYRLVPRNFFAKLANDIQPEMQRSSLETVILMCKKLEIESPKNLLCDALDRPKISGIERAVSTLKELGALTITIESKLTPGQFIYDEGDGDLTFVGKVMSDLPIPQQCTRLILLGHCFGVMQEAIIIAAGLSVKNPFQAGFQKQLDTYLEKMKHARKSFSDLFALLNVYKFWIKNYSENGENYGPRKSNKEYQWAKGAMVHLPVLREIKQTVELLEERLKRLGITDTFSLATDQNPNNIELSSEQGLFLKLAIAGAFYPHYFLRRRPDLRQYEREINKEVNGNDFFRTVYFKGFPMGHNGKLYAKHVADYLTCGLSTPAVKFDGQKVLAIFDNTTGDTIGPFSQGIFRAIKLRQLRSATDSLEFNILWKEQEHKELANWEQKVRSRNCIICPPLRQLPPIYKESVKVQVQHINSPSQFWIIVEQDFNKHFGLTKFIQDNLIPIPLPFNKLCPNSLCLAPYDGLYYRAKILRADRSPTGKSLVYFVDYGNSSWVSNSVLHDFSPTHLQMGAAREPCMAIECRLKELKPNIVIGLHWSLESVDLMKKFCMKAPNLLIEIFSIHNSIMSGELVGYGTKPNGAVERCSLNELLSSRNESGKLYGEKAPESYLSMENHRKRQRASLMDEDEKNAASYEQIGDPLDLDFMDPPRNGRMPVVLKGPWSPLEMNFQACVKCSQTKEVRVENSSVNSVLLDHEPTTSNSRMLVAAHVSVTSKSQACMIRDSTVMPSIPGILSLVTMMFAPTVELRVNSTLSKYTGAVAGCGTVKDRHGCQGAVHPDNDMEIVFDTEVDDDDIDRINIIRYHLNLLLRNSRGVNKSEYHKRLKDDVIKLLRRVRKRIDEEIWPQEEHVWNRIDPRFLNQTIPYGMTFEHYDIFQPHRKVLLNRMEEEEVRWDGGY